MQTQQVNCPICKSDKTKFLFEDYDHAFGYPESGRIYNCLHCTHVFVDGELSPEQLTDMYTNYYPRSIFNVDDYKPYNKKSSLLYWLDGEDAYTHNHVPFNVKVLDIGCGYCETLGFHKNRGCEVYGVEADSHALAIAQRYGFNIDIGLFDYKKYEENFFDYVTMQQVFEHLVDPRKTLTEIHKILKPGGSLILSIPNLKAFGRYFFGKYWCAWHIPFHRHFFNKKSMELIANETGFSVETMKSSTETTYLLYNWGSFFCAGRKKGEKASAAYQTLGRFDSEIKKNWYISLYLFIQKYRLFSLAMRLVDLLGVGDHYLVILKKQ
ncbi:MAG: class I SAM-dependent methyltransferase [Thermoguttaceae bacterium]